MSLSSAVQPTPPPPYFFHHRQSELNALFDQLGSPSVAEMDGVYRGYLFAIKGVDALPALLRGAIYRTLASLINPWHGKRFDGRHGANVWFTGSGRATYGEYDIVAPQQDNAPLQLNYDVDANLRLLRPIRGEVRKLADGVLLARMRYQTKTATPTLLYFTLYRNPQP